MVKEKTWFYSKSKNPVPDRELWVKQYPGRPPNNSFPFEGSFYLEKSRLAFNPKAECWYSLSITQEYDDHWVPDQYFDGEPTEGGIEQLSDTVLARWKKANEPDTQVSLAVPTESPQVSY